MPKNAKNKKIEYPAILIVRCEDGFQIVANVATEDEALELAREYLASAGPEDEDTIPPDEFELHSRNANGRFAIVTPLYV